LETDLVSNGRLNGLCDVSLRRIKELTRDTEAFLDVLWVSTEEKTRLVDHPPFRNWMMGYVREKSKDLNESNFFRDTIMENSELAWRLCSLLISLLGGMGNGTRARTPPNK
jgi:hypothetical protein